MSRAGALEYHIKRYQQSQHAVLAFVRAFIDAHEEYEQEYGKLAAYCQSFAKRKTDESLLDDVVQDLENAITTCANSHTTLVDELKRFVLRSLETVISQDQQQIKRRHSDIKAALQRDKVHRRHLLFVMTRQGSPMSGGGLVRLFQRQLSSSVLDNQASNSHDNDGSRLKQLMELRSRCYHERSECYRHLDSLTVNHEQYELSVRALLVRFMKALGQYSETTCAAIKRGRINSHVQQSETQVQAYEGFVGHIETMTWMISSFSQLISMEESITKRLQRFVKAHCSSIVDSVSLLEQFVEYQKLLALTLADPICRTLKCSKQKCEAIERELLQAIEKTQKSLRASQGKLTVQEARWKQRRAMLERSADDAAISLSFAASFDAALRSAWDRLGSPRMKLPKSRSMNSAGMAMAISEGKTDEQLLLIESEITKTKELINTLEKTLADQKSEMTTILAETSTIGVKTMKLMVDDYQKKVTTALQSVNTALKASNETMAFVLLAQGVAFRTCVAFADDNLSGIILDDKPEYEATEEDKALILKWAAKTSTRQQTKSTVTSH